MIVLVFLLWMMTAILFLTNPKNQETRWGSLIAFYGGCGGLGVMLGDGPNRPEWILWADSIATSFGHYMTPYSIGIFGLVFANVFKTTKQSAIWKLVLLIPIGIMYCFFNTMYPVFKTNYTMLATWSVPYVLGCNILLLYSTFRERRPAIKKNKLYTSMVIIPMTTFALISNIVLEALGIRDVWFYNPYVIAFQFTLFAYLIIKYGFLDVQIRFERQKRDDTMRAVASGTAMLNHTIKNEVLKIDMLVNQIKENSNLDNESVESIELALSSTNHVLELSTRIQSKLDVMNLKESAFWLSDCIETTLDNLQPYLGTKISINKSYEVDAKVYADPIHLQEVFINIIKNAIEAMDKHGEIHIKIYKTYRKVYIDFTDTGKGIEKDKLPLVLNPFYSTKGTKGNYGLGLSYCYNVLQKHGGEIAVKSKVGHGTNMILSLPSKRVKEIKLQSNSDS